MNRRHTKGPWCVSGTRWRPVAAVRAANRKAVAHFSWMTANALGPSEVNANARLIAAAPDLLEALNGCVEVLESAARQDHRYREQLVRVRATIAKATG